MFSGRLRKGLEYLVLTATLLTTSCAGVMQKRFSRHYDAGLQGYVRTSRIGDTGYEAMGFDKVSPAAAKRKSMNLAGLYQAMGMTASDYARVDDGDRIITSLEQNKAYVLKEGL